MLNELKNRGVKDILVICADGLSGMKEAVAAAYPQTELQRCIVHQVRNTLKYVGEKNKKEFANDLKTRVAEPSFFCNYPLKYFLVSLPFALVYFSHILFSKEKVSLRFTQDLSSLAAVLRLSPVSLLFFASDWTGAIVLLILKYSVHLMIYGMATAVILDTTVSFVKKALSMRNYR